MGLLTNLVANTIEGIGTSLGGKSPASARLGGRVPGAQQQRALGANRTTQQDMLRPVHHRR